MGCGQHPTSSSLFSCQRSRIHRRRRSPWPPKALVSRTPQFQWFGDRDSNPDLLVQSQPSCHWTIPERRAPGGTRTPNVPVKSRLRFQLRHGGRGRLRIRFRFIFIDYLLVFAFVVVVVVVRRAHVSRRGGRRTRTLVQAVYGRGNQPVECPRGTKKSRPRLPWGGCARSIYWPSHSRPTFPRPGQILSEITDDDHCSGL